MEITVAGRPFTVSGEECLHEALRETGVPLESPCGGRGRCGRCRVRLTGPVPLPTQAERDLLGEAELAAGFRLACQHRAAPGLGVTVVTPGLDLVARRKAALDARRGFGAGFTPFPLVRKVPVSIDPAGLADARGVWERFVAALPAGAVEPGEGPPAPAGLHVLRELAGALRQNEGRVTAVCGQGKVLAVEPGDTSGRAFGIALDLGTTTIAAYLVDLTSGAGLAVASADNPQAVLGADLMSRLGAALRPGGRSRLRQAVVDGVNDLIRRLESIALIKREDIYAAAVVGNTAMHHLFLDLEVEQLAMAPYVPTVTRALTLLPPEAGLDINPAGLVYVLPNIGGFVGADLAGVMLATGLGEPGNPRLVVDLGTNGEVLLGDREGVLACSAPAGPAFEGGAISCGMRATPGAVQAVAVAARGDGPRLSLDVIGGGPPLGVCGSGLVDAAAGLLELGLLERDGRLKNGSVALAGSVRLTQQDIRQLQLAKGAIRAGAEILLAERGIGPGDLEEVLLAGTFGNYVDAGSALAIGLLPPVKAERVKPVGNAAAAGAQLALLSAEARRAVEAGAARVTHVSLAARPDFEGVFLTSLSF